MLNAERLRASLPIYGLGEPLYFYPNIGSTNDRAADFARQGSPHGTLVVAEEQTSGRGRAGRYWFTPPDSALALSLVLRPQCLTPETLGELTVLGALAVVEALENVGIEALIKWPNDVLIHGRKVAGVLIEASWLGNELEFAILGIGVNVRPKSVPPEEEVDTPATCVEAIVGQQVDRHDLLLDVIRGVGKWYPYLGLPEMLVAWDQRLAYRGRMVKVQLLEGEILGRVQGLAIGGSLQLTSENGEMIEVAFGEVHLRPVDMSSK
ncbi:MAG: biotin--[acetyl-CoA-carboxylase] ligase [Anaerolineales bacterium]|nr:MAG: biotin--[acetyl-CoA-carboxylase] ligase [Anaerolineales bacterium]